MQPRAWFRNVYFTGARLRGACATLEDVDIDDEIRNIRINAVDIGPLVEVELNRHYPERRMLDPATADGFRRGMSDYRAAWHRPSSGPSACRQTSPTTCSRA